MNALNDIKKYIQDANTDNTDVYKFLAAMQNDLNYYNIAQPIDDIYFHEGDTISVSKSFGDDTTIEFNITEYAALDDWGACEQSDIAYKIRIVTL